MAVSIVDFSTPAAGFDQPLALWEACHDRVRRMIGLLQRLAEHIEKIGVDENARITATSIRRYFDEAAPRHHDDEEIDLFPRLLARMDAKGATPEAGRVAAAIETLRADHNEMKSMWAALRGPLAQIEAGEAATLDDATVALFAMRYRHHVEDTQIAPALRRWLTKSDLDAVGKAMAERRGVNWSELAAPR
jgi:hemerythrin-like domain-containing protein